MSNNEYVRKRVSDFQQAIVHDKLNNKFDNYQFAVKCLLDIVRQMSASYDNYRHPVPRVLYIFEWLSESLLYYTMPILNDYCNEILNNSFIIPEDLSIANESVDDILVLFMDTLGKSLKENNRVEMSEFKFDLDGCTDVEIKKMLSLVIDFLEHKTEILEWDQETVEIMFLNIAAGRVIAKKLGQLDIFYFSTGMFLDRLYVSGRQQHARDISENILLCSFLDGVPEWGFFMEFKVFSAQGDVSASVLYALLYMHVILEKAQVNELLLKETAWQFVKFYRNVSLFDFAVEFYDKIPKRIKFDAYKTRALRQTMFSCMLAKNDDSLPELALEYLHFVREDVFKGGMHDCLPWLILLYNIRRRYNLAHSLASSIGYFITVFESIFPEEMVASFKKLLVDSEFNPLVLIDDLKKSIIKLSEARSLSDFSYDNEMALKISQAIVMSDDIEGFLLAMMIKSDFGLFFHEKVVDSPRQFSFVNADSSRFYDSHKDYSVLSNINGLKQYDVVWLAMSGLFLRQCTLFNSKFEIQSLEKWKHKSFYSIKENIKPLLIHETTKKVRGQVRLLVEEDYEIQIEEIKEVLSFARIHDYSPNPLLLVKDMDISDFPHNLLLNDMGVFLLLKKPIANVLSTDKLLESLDDKSMSKNISKCVWIPVEAGDIAINRLFSQVEDVFNKFDFRLHTNVSVLHPLDYDLSILVCHGADDISKFNVIYPGGDSSIFDIESILGEGKILILFVCHSGSMDKDFFQNKISALIKRFLDLGYRSIIAPFWALSIDVPPIWLPIFMQEFESGAPIVNCVWKANLAVKEQYLNSTPALWACLHLYGNPFLRLDG
jgi:hypothetical protein